MVAIWAISDLHLAKGNPEKNMGDKFPGWKDYHFKLEKNWNEVINSDDYVLMPGDISWSTRLENALEDLKFIDALPGKKIISQGNHDFWWPSKNKIKSLGLESIIFLNNDIIKIEDIVIGAIKFADSYDLLPEAIKYKFSEKSFAREESRLNIILKMMNEHENRYKIIMMHYPPATNKIPNTKITELLANNGVDECLFGHIHDKDADGFNNIKSSISCRLVAADYLDFKPIKILNM